MRKALAELQAEDAVMRVTRWTFEPATETGWHRHAYLYRVVACCRGGDFSPVRDERWAERVNIQSGPARAYDPPLWASPPTQHR